MSEKPDPSISGDRSFLTNCGYVCHISQYEPGTKVHIVVHEDDHVVVLVRANAICDGCDAEYEFFLPGVWDRGKARVQQVCDTIGLSELSVPESKLVRIWRDTPAVPVWSHVVRGMIAADRYRAMLTAPLSDEPRPAEKCRHHGVCDDMRARCTTFGSSEPTP